MCGIFGMLGHADLTIGGSKILDGLKRLEYRGYDSWGIYMPAWGNNSNLAACHYREVGCPSSTSFEPPVGYRAGIGHTRWATIGKVTEENAHPHLSRILGIALVHNGIVKSVGNDEQTDTYISVEMLEQIFMNMKRFDSEIPSTEESEHFYNAMKRLSEIQGHDNTFCAIHPSIPNAIYASVNGSKTLFINNEGYVSSDIKSLAGCGSTARMMKNETIQLMKDENNEYWIINENNKQLLYQWIQEKPVEIPKQVDKPIGSSSMLQEIKEQSYVMKPAYLSWKTISMRQYKKQVILFGCGSSYYAAMFGQKCFEALAHKQARAEYSSEWNKQNPIYLGRHNDFDVIAISQSGETKDTIEALYSPMKCKPIVITNNPTSYLALQHKNISMDVGHEDGVAATKTFTASCLRLLELAALECETPNVLGYVQTLLNSQDFRGVCQNTIEKCENLNGIMDGYSRCLFLGTGFTYPIALEGALKMKEVAYISAEGMPAAEMKHGPIALVDDTTLSVFVVSKVTKQIQSNIDEIKSRKGKVLLITSEKEDDYNVDDTFYVKKMHKYYDQIGQFRYVNEAFQAIILNIPLQFMAYYAAVNNGTNPDRPRNLAKCVTV